MRRVFVGLVKDHKTKIGRIKATRKQVFAHGCKSKVKDSKR